MAKEILARFPRSWNRARRRVVVLCWHSIHPTYPFASARPAEFEQQVRWLKEHCDIVSLDSVLDRVRDSAQDQVKPAVAITFDDGYEDNLRYALPVLVDQGVEASFFITTGFIDGDSRAMDTMRFLRRTEVSALTWSQVSTIRQAGMEIGSHGVSHPNFAELTEASADVEMTQSRRTLEDHLGEEVRAFAYPFGVPGKHVTEATVRSAAKAGYTLAASMLHRNVRNGDDPLLIPRIAVKSNDLRMLSAKVAGNLDVIGRWQQWQDRGKLASGANPSSRP